MTKIKTYIRIILLTLILTTLIIGGSFYYGTFNPNDSVIEKIQKDFHKKEVEEVIYLGLVQPEYDYNDKESFIKATGKCVDYLNFTTDRAKRVPTSMIIAMAGIESGWGTSRFATEGNALFGVRTWDPAVPQMKARGNLNADWGVKKYETKCDSVKEMQGLDPWTQWVNIHTGKTELFDVKTDADSHHRKRERSELQIKLGVKLIYVNLHKRTIRVEGRVEELRT